MNERTWGIIGTAVTALVVTGALFVVLSHHI
jgi:hypothetical protein